MNSNIGVIGLSVMGMNLALNMADHGYKVSIFNRTTEVVDRVLREHPHENLVGTHSLGEFVSTLEKPRRVFLMVKSGNPVDMLIDQLLEYLEEGDIIIDGGNSYFRDTIRRTQYLESKKINFLGVGISGGEEGARFGPAIMPGGDEDAYSYVKDIFENISAKAFGEPCCTYISKDGAGHYVKMVHNGIEYGDMQLISEAYTILKEVGKMTNDEIQSVFEEWNKGELDSYLIEITSNILKVKEEDGGYLLDKILDVASQKGTGKWVNHESIDLGVDISVISAAINARFMSNLKEERVKASSLISPSKLDVSIDRERLVSIVRDSLYTSKIVSYAQGFKLLSVAEREYGWNLDFSKMAKIFRGGCIIRAKFLNDISDAFSKDKDVANLMFTEFFLNEINSRLSSLRELVGVATSAGVPIASMTNALSYIDTYRSAVTGANVIQAQRDYFGAHTFQRVDKEGSFHFDWINSHE